MVRVREGHRDADPDAMPAPAISGRAEVLRRTIARCPWYVPASETSGPSAHVCQLGPVGDPERQSDGRAAQARLRGPMQPTSALQQPCLAQAEVGAAGDDQVVEDPDFEQEPGPDHEASERAIVGTRFRIARRVVVREDDGSGPQRHRPGEDLARSDRQMGQVTAGDGLEAAQQSEPRVEWDDAEGLDRLRPQIGQVRQQMPGCSCGSGRSIFGWNRLASSAAASRRCRAAGGSPSWVRSASVASTRVATGTLRTAAAATGPRRSSMRRRSSSARGRAAPGPPGADAADAQSVTIAPPRRRR